MLPDFAPPVIKEAFNKMDGLSQASTLDALNDSVIFPAEMLSHFFAKAGHSVSPSTIRSFRREMARQ